MTSIERSTAAAQQLTVYTWTQALWNYQRYHSYFFSWTTQTGIATSTDKHDINKWSSYFSLFRYGSQGLYSICKYEYNSRTTKGKWLMHLCGWTVRNTSNSHKTENSCIGFKVSHLNGNLEVSGWSLKVKFFNPTKTRIVLTKSSEWVPTWGLWSHRRLLLISILYAAWS